MAKTNKDAAFGLRAIGKVGQNRDNQGLGEYSISSSKMRFQQQRLVQFTKLQLLKRFFLDHSMESFTLIQQLVSLRLLITMKVQ